jgi:chromosome segregation ATPase
VARESEVKYSRVEEACIQLFTAGESISFSKVYALIDSKGGQQVVTRYINQWKLATADRLKAARKSPLPQTLVSTADALVEQLWRQANEQANTAFLQERGSLDMERSEMQVRLDAAANQVSDVERENARLQGELTGLQAVLSAKDMANQELEVRVRELTAALGARDDQVAALREDLARAMTTLEAERARFDETLQTSHQRHAAELDQMHQREEENRRHFLTQVDQLNQANKVQAAHLREQLEGQKAQSEAYRRQAYQARDDASKWQGRTEAAQEELAEAKKILGKIQRHREKAGAPPAKPAAS